MLSSFFKAILFFIGGILITFMINNSLGRSLQPFNFSFAMMLNTLIILFCFGLFIMGDRYIEKDRKKMEDEKKKQNEKKLRLEMEEEERQRKINWGVP